MSDFNKALSYVLDNEGVYSDDSADHGGKTRFGITEAVAIKHGFDVTALTREQASLIYHSDYWRFDEVVNQQAATKLLDMAINFGLVEAITILQTVFSGEISVPEVAITVDGKLGPMTLAAVNQSDVDVLVRYLALESCKRYAHLAGDATQLKFLRGWILRAVNLPPKEI